MKLSLTHLEGLHKTSSLSLSTMPLNTSTIKMNKIGDKWSPLSQSQTSRGLEEKPTKKTFTKTNYLTTLDT